METLISVQEFLHVTGTPAQSKGDDYLIDCLWHTGKTKIRINKQTGVFNCFRCKAHGNLWTLCLKMTGKNLYDFLGITPEKRRILSFDRTLAKARTEVVEEVKIDDIIIQGESYDIHGDNVPNFVQKAAKELYLTPEYCEYYGVKYSLNQHIRGAHIPEEKRTTYSNRFVWPIYLGDKLVNVDGRTMVGDNPKVIYCKGGKTATMFDINRLDPTKLLIVCEGIKDTIKLWHLGYRNITAVLGASISEEQIRQLRLFKEIVFLIDNDEAGLEAADKLYEQLNIELQIGLPPEGQDPFKCSFTQLQDIIENRKDYTDYDLAFIKEQSQNNASSIWLA